MDHLRDKNIAAFERFDPDLANIVKGHAPGRSVTFATDMGRHDVLVDGVSLYRGNAKRNGVRHLSRFLRAPTRIDLQFGPGFVDGYLEDKYAEDIRRVEAVIGNDAPQPVGMTPVPDPYFFVCFGVGLGFHLGAILDRLRIKSLFICEENLDLVHHSLDVFDWDGFLSAAEERSVVVRMCLAQSEVVASLMFVEHMNASCPSAIDGMQIYKHYDHPYFDRVQNLIVGELPWLVHDWGTFDDEIAQLGNTAANLKQSSKVRLVEPPQAAGDKPTAAEIAAAENDLTAIVVGAGPSLSGSLKDLASLRGKAVIVSAGSALLPLLKAGIQPDIHAEVERAETLFSNFANIHREYGLDDLALVLSTTADPGFLKAFPKNDIFMYLRDGLCPSVLLSGLIHPLIPSGPTCDHIAVGLSLALGVRRIAFVGNDYGTKEPDIHHAEGSVFEEEFFQSSESEEGMKKYYEFDQTAEGNFGGTVYTSFLYLRRKHALEGGIRAFKRVRFFNASDGARIEGATPIRSLGELPGLSQDRAAEIRDLVTGTRDLAIDPTVVAERLEATRRAVEAHPLSNRLTAAADATRDGDWIFDTFVDFLNDAGVDHMYRVVFSGNLHRILFAFAQLSKRHSNPETRRSLEQAFLTALAARARTMEDQLLETLDSVLTA